MLVVSTIERYFENRTNVLVKLQHTLNELAIDCHCDLFGYKARKGTWSRFQFWWLGSFRVNFLEPLRLWLVIVAAEACSFVHETIPLKERIGSKLKRFKFSYYGPLKNTKAAKFQHIFATNGLAI